MAKKVFHIILPFSVSLERISSNHQIILGKSCSNISMNVDMNDSTSLMRGKLNEEIEKIFFNLG